MLKRATLFCLFWLVTSLLFGQEPSPFYLRDTRSENVVFIEGLLKHDLLALARQEGEQAFDHQLTGTNSNSPDASSGTCDELWSLAALLFEIYEQQWFQVSPQGQQEIMRQVEHVQKGIAGVTAKSLRAQQDQARFTVAEKQLQGTMKTEVSDSGIPEKAALKAFRDGQNQEAIALYDQAGRIALTAGDRKNAFRLLGAAAALTEKFPNESDDTVTATMTRANRFLELAESFPEEPLAPTLYDHALKQLQPLVAAGQYTSDDLLARRIRFAELFPGAKEQIPQQYETGLLLLTQRRVPEGISLLTHLLEKAPPTPEIFFNAMQQFNQLLPEIGPEAATFCLKWIQDYEASNARPETTTPNKPITSQQARLLQRVKALAFLATGQNDQANELLASLVETGPNDTKILTLYAELLTRTNDTEQKQKAILLWNQVTEQTEEGPLWRKAKQSIITLYRETGREQEADKLQKLLELVWPE